MKDGAAFVNASGSYDPDGGGLYFEWDWGDGQDSEGFAVASHRYREDGSYSVTLAVTDQRSAVAIARQVVEVQVNEPPVAYLVIWRNGTEVAADASLSFDPEGTVLSFAWDWGDNSFEIGPAETTHRYANGGRYGVRLGVTDADGLTTTLDKWTTIRQRVGPATEHEPLVPQAETASPRFPESPEVELDDALKRLEQALQARNRTNSTSWVAPLLWVAVIGAVVLARPSKKH